MRKAVLALAIAACLLAGCSGSGGLFIGSSRPSQVDSAELQFQTPAEGDPIAVISTSMGDISIVLYPEYAPMAVENFTGLAGQGYFEGVTFHRVEKDFIIQTGDATGTGQGGASIWQNRDYPIEYTPKLRHYAGAVALAAASDGSVDNLSQFYIVSCPADTIDRDSAQNLTDSGLPQQAVDTYRQVGGAPYLDGLDTVFGQVYDGMDVVDAINAVETDENGRPLEDVSILSVTVGTYSAANATDSTSAASGTSAAESMASAAVSSAAGAAA